jgi:DNA-binding NtrC family response regulator/tetratricopeptide (TPR) repeat protein
MGDFGAVSESGKPSGLSSKSPPVSRSSRPAWKLGEGIRQLRLGDLHFSADRFSTAQTYYEKALELLAGSSDDGDLSSRADVRVAECLRWRGLLDGALTRLREARQRLPEPADPLVEGKIQGRMAEIHVVRGDYPEALSLGLQAFEKLRTSNEHAELAAVEHTLGRVYSRLGDVDKAREAYESALYSFRRVGEREGVVRCLNNLGLLLKNTPRWRQARDFLTRALSMSEELGHYARVGFCALNLAILETKLGQWSQAQAHLNRALAIGKDVNNVSFLAKVHLGLGLLRHRSGQGAQAEFHYEEAWRLAAANAYHRERLLALEFRADLLMERGRWSEAREILEDALKGARSLAAQGDLVGELTHRLARVHVERGDLRNGYRLAWESAEICRALEFLPDLAAATGLLAEILHRSGATAAAARAYEATLVILRKSPDVLARARLKSEYARFIIEATRLFGSAETGVDLARAWKLLDEAATTLEGLEPSPSTVELMAAIADIEGRGGRLASALERISRVCAAADRLGRPDLVERLDGIRTRLEEGSAENALREAPAFRAADEWNLVWMGTSGRERLEKLLEFALNQIKSDRGFLALQEKKSFRIETVAEMPRAAADLLAKRIGAAMGRDGSRKLCLATDLARDPRFSEEAKTLFSQTRSFVAAKLDLPGGRSGLLYLDRSLRNLRGSYGEPDLRLLSLMGSLAAMAMAETVREREKPGRDGEDLFPGFVTRNAELRRSLVLLDRIKVSQATILILGETGTGKGLLARCVHEASPRADGPFLQVNCAALPESLLESELFGYVRGAFTGATDPRKGLFEESVGGTLFLDEVDKTSPALQAKLLHVLDQREVRPVGSNKWIRVDTRVLCASNSNLRDAIQRGEFLEDLYYRLNDFVITIPPLRERREDIPVLVERFFETAVRELGRVPRGFSREVLKALMDAPWRGNIRELEKLVRRLVVLAEDGDLIRADLLPAEFLGADLSLSSDGLRGEVSRLERRVIAACLRDVGWNKSEAARRLKISYPSLLKKIRALKIRPS